MSDTVIDPRLLAGTIEPETPRSEVVADLPMRDYRAHAGFAPSDMKWADLAHKRQGVRGHPLRLIERLKDRMAGKSEASTEAQEDGSLYHTLVLEPELFTRDYIVVDKQVEQELVQLAIKRKLYQAYSPHLTEAKNWVKANGRKPNGAEQAAILAEANARKAEEVEFHSRLTEFVEWREQQAAAGKTVVYGGTVQKYQEMADALYTHPLNRDVAAYLQHIRRKAQVEASVFCVAQIRRPGDRIIQVQLKGRPDLIGGGDVLNLKSALSIQANDFQESAAKWDYPFSEGAYALMLEWLGRRPDRVGYLAQEKEPPYFAQVHWLPYEWLNYGAVRFLTVLKQFIHCYDTGDWCLKDYNGDIDPKNPNGCGFVLQHPVWMDNAVKQCPDLLERTPF